jgi:hypothetical protein
MVKIRDRLMLYITLGVLGFIGLVLLGEYAVVMYSQSKTGEVVGKSKVNEAGNYTKPGMRKALFNKIKAGSKGGDPGEWSARKAQLLAVQYKKAGGGYK